MPPWPSASECCWTTRRVPRLRPDDHAVPGSRRAVRAWGQPPDAPAGLADRIFAVVPAPIPPRAHPRARIRRERQFWRFSLPLAAAAAAIAAAITVGLISRLIFNWTRAIQPGPSVAVMPALSREPETARSRMLNTALTDATNATWDLARSTSGPAARIGRQVFDAATNAEGAASQPGFAVKPVPDSITGLSLDSLAPDSAAAAATLQQVGDHLASGVRPLSSTARQAFGFLLGPARPKPEARPQSPAARGA